MLSPQLSQKLLYTSAGLSIFAAYKHTSVCLNDFFPILNRRLGPDDSMTLTTKSQMLQISATFVTIGIAISEIPLPTHLFDENLCHFPLSKGSINLRWFDSDPPIQMGEIRHYASLWQDTLGLVWSLFFCIWMGLLYEGLLSAAGTIVANSYINIAQPIVMELQWKGFDMFWMKAISAPYIIWFI